MVPYNISASASGRSMLEAGALPVRDLAALAVREGRRPKPVYGTHKWFARRLGSAFRALLVASALPEGGDFWTAFERGVDLTGTTVLDPFVGGGTSVIEAQRLGMTCIGTDVDAVAVAITSFQSRLASLPDLEAVLEDLAREVGEEVQCPSSNALRQARRLPSGGSGSSELEVMRPAADAASGVVGWSVA
jgi:hypothetical protein